MSDPTPIGEVIPDVMASLLDQRRCDITDLPAYSCAHCTGRDGGEGEEKKALDEVTKIGLNW